MNITRENFEKLFPLIVDAISDSHFVTIDCEFTGLRLADAARERSMDSIQARYDGGRSSASSFTITQYGVCCFRFNDNGKLEARPFNCFVFPSTKFRTDRVFSCQSSSMDFLSKHGFDFQAWAAHGVPFLSRAEEAIIRQNIEQRQAREVEAAKVREMSKALSKTKEGGATAHVARDGTSLETMTEVDRDLVVNAQQKAKALIEEVNSATGEYEERSVKLDPMNGRQRWLMYEFVGKCYPGVKLSNLSGPGNARGIEIRTVPVDVKQRALEEEKAREEANAKVEGDLRSAVGFRRVIDELSKSGKPVVAHNSMLDLLHTYDKFVGPLPFSHEEGTQALHSLFPCLFDNKVAMSAAIEAGFEFPRTVLGDGFQWLRDTHAAAESCPENGVESTSTDEKAVSDVGTSILGGVTEGSAPNRKYLNQVTDVQSATSPGKSRAADAAETKNGKDEKNKKGDDDDEEEAQEAEPGDEPERRERAVWDAVFPREFDKRYVDGHQEHEAAYDAYLTGCCFVASAVLGMCVGVEDLMLMGTGDGETPEALRAVQNVVPLYRMIADQKLCLPGPTPPPDLSKALQVSGFTAAVQTDAILRALAGADTGNAGHIRFHWIDDISGVAEFKSAEAASVVLEAYTVAKSAAAAEDRAADPTNVKLEDLHVVTVVDTGVRNRRDAGNDGVDDGGVASVTDEDITGHGKKRPRPEGTTKKTEAEGPSRATRKRR